MIALFVLSQMHSGSPQTVGKHNIVSILAVISAENTDSLYISSVVVIMGTFTAFRGEKEENDKMIMGQNETVSTTRPLL